uniref:Uncharacterized protein n=1 Tax=Rhodopseudomonas palustris (strain DX-1) TaxID=652103 RepID=E6VFM5_RHOPX
MPKLEEVTKSDALTVATFKTHSVKNEAASAKAGRPIYDDMEVCELRYPGNRETVGVFPAHEAFGWREDPQSGEREQLTYALAYPDQYHKFKLGEAQVQSGTPLAELPFLTQGKRLELKALNIHTAEALAALDGKPLKMLGQGGRDLKDQAQVYLDNAAGSADVVALAEQNAALKREIEALKRGLAPAETDGDDEVEDRDAGGESGDETSPFAAMDDIDIANWLEQATGKRPPANIKRATLIKRADEANATLAKDSEAA